jgi:predicted transcriptional regulator
MNGNTLTIELPDDVAAQLSAMPEEERNRFAVAALTSALNESAEWDESADPEAITEIGAALAHMDECHARGEYGLTLDEAWAELDRRAAERRRLSNDG